MNTGEENCRDASLTPEPAAHGSDSRPVSSDSPLESKVKIDESEIVTAHINFVLKLARVVSARMKRYVDTEDLAQTGMIGLIHAAAAYDPENPAGWRSYARLRVVGAMLDSLREQDPASRYQRSREKKIEKARQSLQFELGRTPSDDETANALCMSLDALYSFAAMAQSYQPPQTDVFGDADSMSSIEDKRAPKPDEIFQNRQLADVIKKSLKNLTAKEREIISLYYFEEKTSAEIAAKLNRSEARVSQIHSAALRKLGRILSNYKPLDADKRNIVRRRNRRKEADLQPPSNVPSSNSIVSSNPDLKHFGQS